MSITRREKEVVLSNINDNLSKVVGASGQPEELVRLTTAIVQGAKRLLEGVPESLSTRSTSALTSFVLCAKSVAKDPRGVDANAIKQLSSTRSEVDKIVQELEKWHFQSKSPVSEDLTKVMEAISKPQDTRQSPEGQLEPERETHLTRDLKHKRDTLLMKMDPQRAPPPVGNPQEVMMTAVKGLMRGADELTKYADGKLPSKDTLLEPMVLVVDMVCKLLDLVDNLFVSKYPMRSQVYSFCSALIDNVLAYGCRSKSEDILSLRNICTQTPALLNAAKVMVEQCEIRHSSIDDNKEMSMRRTKELKQMDDAVKEDPTPVAKKKTKPPEQPKPEPKPTFELCCIVCTSVVVDQKTQQPISRGTELNLVVSSPTTVKNVKQDLAGRTGLPSTSIQLNQGQEELFDSVVINPNSPLPYFLFNRDEPTEDEMRERKKDERKKNKLTVENMDWSIVTGPVAVAVFEYDTLGDDKSLAFDEGDIVEILEKSADGWWEGRCGDKVGTFPASFVKEIKTKEEAMRVLEKGGGGDTLLVDTLEETGKSSPITRQASDVQLSGGHSPKPFAKLRKNPMNRGMSNPDLSVSDIAKNKERGRVGSLFQKKKKNTGYTNLSVFEEEPTPKEDVECSSPVESPTKQPPKPLYKPRRSFGSGSSSPVSKPKPFIPRVLGDEESGQLSSPRSASPKENKENGKQSIPSPKSNVGGAKKRPPPPRPQPYAKTHPTQAAKLDVIIKAHQSIDDPNADLVKVNGGNDEKENSTNLSLMSKESSSMEDMLKNLQDFEEAEFVERTSSVSSNKTPSIEYETCERPKTPPTDEVVTIKVSEYKPDSDNEDDEEEEEEDEDKEQQDGEEEGNKSEEEGVSSRNGKLFCHDEEWNPREWMPSPEPTVRSSCKPPSLPSFSVEVNAKQQRSDHTSPLSSSGSIGESQNMLPVKNKPLPPPKVMSRPRRSFSSSPKLTPSGSPGTTPSGSPMLVPREDHSSAAAPKKPIPPPRQKRKGTTGSVGKGDNDKPRCTPSRPPPPPPYQAAGIRTSHSEMDMQGSKVLPLNSNSSGLHRRLTVSKQREKLRSKPPTRSRSPVVQRKTKAVVTAESHLGKELFIDIDLQCSGIGKEGILYKEGSQSSEWKPRYFHVVNDGLLYYDSNSSSERESNPLGELSVNRIVKAMPVDSRGIYHCFIILMRYETSILLGTLSEEDRDDWVASVNKIIRIARLRDKPPSFQPSLSAAEYCLHYLLNTSVPLNKKVFKLSGDIGLLKEWIDCIDSGQEPNLSRLTNASSALYLLRSLLTPNKLEYVIPSEIAKEISQQVKKNAPMYDIQSKLHHIHDDMLHILQLFLSVFAKALEEKGRNESIEVSDLNRMFGSVLFEGLKSNQSLTLLAFMIKNHKTMF